MPNIAVGAGTNKQFIATKNTAKLDRESEELKHDKIPLDVGKIIQQGRNAKGLSQKDLATVYAFLFLYSRIFKNISFCLLENRKSVKNHKLSTTMKLVVAYQTI